MKNKVTRMKKKQDEKMKIYGWKDERWNLNSLDEKWQDEKVTGWNLNLSDEKTSGWKNVRMKKRQDEKTAGWKNNRMKKWPDEETTGWKKARMKK